jgi:hypothetical protein
MSQKDNSSSDGAQQENLRAHWSRTTHRNLQDPRTVRAIQETGSALIGRWEHKDRSNPQARVRYTYEPGADNPYLVSLPALDISERFSTRSSGASFNKELLRSPQITGELEISTCGEPTSDGDPCQVQVSEPDSTCHLHGE